MKQVPYRRPTIRRHTTKFSRPGELAPSICALLSSAFSSMYFLAQRER